MKILLFLSNGIEAYEASAFTDVFGWNYDFGNPKIKLDSCSLNKNIKCTWNLRVKTEYLINEIEYSNYEALIIPGGFGKAGFFNDIKDKRVIDMIRYFDENNKWIIGVCTGSIAVAESGVLKNREGTTYLLDNKRYFNQLIKHDVIPVEKDIVIDKNIITTSSPGTAVPAAFILLEKLNSKENADYVKHLMGFKIP